VLVWLLLPACAGAHEHHAADAALGPYSAAVVAGGLVFVAGQTGVRRETFADEVDSAIDSVTKYLARAGLGLADVVSSTVHLTDIADFAAMNTVYARRFPAPYPARTTVAVKELPGQARIEITVVAARQR